MVAAYGMTGDSLLLAGVIGYATAAAGYLLLGALVVFYWESALARLTLALAAFATAVWAGATAYSLYADGAVEWLSQLLEIARACGWLFLLLSLLYWVSPAQRSTWAAASIALCVIVA